MNAVNMAPVGWTVSRVARCEVDTSSDMSGTDTARLEEVKLCNSSYTMSSYEDVAYMGDFVDEDFMDTGFDSDISSRSSDGPRGMTHPHGNLGEHLGFICRTQLELFRRYR